jgi:hypothetical protein
MRRHIVERRALTVVTAAVLGTAAVSGVSSAVWSASASGSGAGGAATNLTGVTVVSVAVGDTTATALLPGGSADAIVKVANTNSFPVTVTSVSPAGAVTAANGCTPTGVSFTGQTGSWVVPAGSAGTLIHLPGAVAMDATSASACQGTTFGIPVNVVAWQ